MFAIVLLAAMWRIYRKAGQHGWAAIIPIYNIIVLLRIVGRPWWWVILFLIPLVDIVISIIVYLDLARAFGKGVGFGIGLIIPLINVIFLATLAFSDAQYVGPANRR